MRLIVVFLSCFISLFAHSGALDDMVDSTGPTVPSGKGIIQRSPQFWELFAKLKPEEQRLMATDGIERFQKDPKSVAGNKKKLSVRKCIQEMLWASAPVDVHKAILVVTGPPLQVSMPFTPDDEPFKYNVLKMLIEDKKTLSIEALRAAAKETKDNDLRAYYTPLLQHLDATKK